MISTTEFLHQKAAELRQRIDELSRHVESLEAAKAELEVTETLLDVAQGHKMLMPAKDEPKDDDLASQRADSVVSDLLLLREEFDRRYGR